MTVPHSHNYTAYWESSTEEIFPLSQTLFVRKICNSSHSTQVFLATLSPSERTQKLTDL